ncbi:MAG TPA: hypothetical protein VMG99_01455 [Thermoplasmata archaeon]|nr:hypothetical protein [Thermoplasmata archaeon]
MPGEPDRRSEPPSNTDPTRGSTPDPRVAAISRETRDAVRPWVDIDEVGLEGLDAWLRSIVELLPPPAPGFPRARAPDPATRVRELAAALVECAADRAKVHFQAMIYFRENQALARRVRALEAALRTAASSPADGPGVPADPEVDRAADRYLPGGGGAEL